MLDIGCNVIRTVERQGISMDYVTLACVITVILPVLSVIFHLSSTRSNNQVGQLFASNSSQSLLGSFFLPGADSTSHGLVPTLNGPFADTLLAMHLGVLYALAEKTLTFFGQPLHWLSMLLCVNETSVLDHNTAWSAFTNLATGRWILSWLQSPELQGRLVMLLGIPLRFNVYGAIFFLLCIAERTFQQRLLYAKYFFSLTSARRARKYHVPHFRLNKLRHIKCWLTLRSYLKKRGPQRSVEAIIAAAFYVVFVFGLALCSQLLSRKEESVFGELVNWDILWLTLGIMLFLHRLIIVGTKITKKYRNFSILITEQINLYLSMEKKPHKKDELMSTFQVLRLAEGLLKEVDGPFRVPGSFPTQWTSRPSSSMTDTVRCYVWEGDKLSKFSLTMLDIGCNVIRTVERQGISMDYVTLACVITVILPVLSVIFHLSSTRSNNQVGQLFASNSSQSLLGSFFLPGADSTSHGLVPTLNGPFADTLLAMHLGVLYALAEKTLTFFGQPLHWLSMLLCVNETSVLDHNTAWSAFTNLATGRWILSWLQSPELQGRLVMLLGIPLRFNVYGAIFSLLCIAERTFQQRLLYAKYFFSLTCARRARKYHVPHFRLNKLRHIKCWLTLRSYLKKRGPQRSVEAIIAAAFYVVFVFGLALCSQLLSRKEESVFSELINWDILWLTLGIMLFLHRLIIVGTKITKKYRNFSILITEQINLYLSMEKKPHKKDELMSTFQVLRLAEGLLKEVDGPFRVCGWTVNPLVYNIFKLVLLSCFSSLLSETLGFKLKLYKLKLNAANW
ncbi:hypothetical protein P879_06582 [Paragonimus westermani]|uniref:Homeodomain transcription factor 2 n=1 Tax=Paragonimus westermani TaxID=34504 RepID=A0A8T0DLW9_9TREM|nr:hypothetical protein P879_06582 [Paragonimus westermani]